jgi:RNA binding exosome subunit
MFFPKKYNHPYWQKIKAAVEQGHLGEQAKVSTRSQASMPPEVRRKKEARGDTRFVICVYTYDYEDRADVMRIRQVLRELGIQHPLIYKSDKETREGHYGNTYTPLYRE